MISDPALHRIRIGEATPEEARTAIREALAGQVPDVAENIYTALRAWTWKALQTRRFDSEMSDWYRVIRTTGAAMSDRDLSVSHYVEALAHLVEESLRYAGSHSTKQLLARSHLGEILQAVQLNNGRLDRARLAELLRLGSSRLSQLTTDLIVAGALERETEGKFATFVITDRGREMLETWGVRRRAELVEESAIERKALSSVVHKIKWSDVEETTNEDQHSYAFAIVDAMKGVSKSRSTSACFNRDRVFPGARRTIADPSLMSDRNNEGFSMPAPAFIDTREEILCG